MAHVAILSSWVAYGHVGFSAAQPALQALGHQVTGLPTVMLSNHPGWPNVAGRPVPVQDLHQMIKAIVGNGWLQDVDAVLTGYLPTPDHVELACGLIETIKARRVVVDPILGDRPKGLYLAHEAAMAVRQNLVPLADLLTPNAFELGWLTGLPVATADQVATAARVLGNDVVVTSPPFKGATGVMHVGANVSLWRTPLQTGVPHGVGDVLSGLLAAGLAPGQALGHLDALIGASLNAPHLRIAEAAPIWTQAAPVPES